MTTDVATAYRVRPRGLRLRGWRCPGASGLMHDTDRW